MVAARDKGMQPRDRSRVGGPMAARLEEDRHPIPLNSLVLGYGAVLPCVVAALGVWLMGGPWPILATRLAIIWSAIVLVFIAGVRRGYGFGNPAASTTAEISTMLIYVALAGLSLLASEVGAFKGALALLTAGFILAAVLDRRAALGQNAPRHFARLRGPQLSIASAALAGILAYQASH